MQVVVLRWPLSFPHAVSWPLIPCLGGFLPPSQLEEALISSAGEHCTLDLLLMYQPQIQASGLLPQQSAEAIRARLHATRKPERLTFTCPWRVARELQELSLLEGRSVSNLIAHLLEIALTSMREKRLAEQQNRN